MPKLTTAGILYKIAMDKWESDEWRVRYFMKPHPKEPNLLAQVHWDEKSVYIYPHPNHMPIEKTGLHEILHVGLQLDGSSEPEVYFLEEWIWKRLTKKQRQKLRDLFTSHIDP